MTFDYADESDPGPYPMPPAAPIEGGPASTGDRHVLVVDRDACRLWELYSAYPQNGGTSWTAGSGATWDLAVERDASPGLDFRRRRRAADPARAGPPTRWRPARSTT